MINSSSMVYLGNYADFMKPEWVTEVLAAPGAGFYKDRFAYEGRYCKLLREVSQQIITSGNKLTTAEYQELVATISSMDASDPDVRAALGTLPKLDPAMVDDNTGEYSQYANAGYNLDVKAFEVVDNFDTSFDIPTPPWSPDPTSWWFTRMRPGQFAPMHQDVFARHSVEEAPIRTFWMALSNWEPGFTFMDHTGQVVQWIVGDVFEFSDIASWHAAGNIGRTTRLDCIFTTHVIKL
jgi:hypothetical protein